MLPGPNDEFLDFQIWFRLVRVGMLKTVSRFFDGKIPTIFFQESQGVLSLLSRVFFAPVRQGAKFIYDLRVWISFK
jgi:hypothetical protein